MTERKDSEEVTFKLIQEQRGTKLKTMDSQRGGHFWAEEQPCAGNDHDLWGSGEPMKHVVRSRGPCNKSGHPSKHGLGLGVSAFYDQYPSHSNGQSK